MRIGIFGGTFNPVHKGHLLLCRQVSEKLGLDRVLLIPTNIPPHKEAAELASNAHRLEMLRLAVGDDPVLTVSDIEYRLGKKSYTFFTLTALRQEYPDGEFYLIMGSDMLLTFDEWYRYRDIMDMAFLVAGARQEGEYAALCEKQKKLGEDRVFIVRTEIMDISSTELRQKLKAGEDVSVWLEPAVECYIKEHGLYKTVDETAVLRALEQKLSPKRLQHTLAVARLCEELALAHGADPAGARLAGLLHDYTKEEAVPLQLQMMQDSAILVPAESEKLYHACTAALVAKQQFGVTDPDVLSAIRYHTTGRAGMSLLEQIVFTADAVSYDRNYYNAKELRELAFRDLDACTLAVIEFVLDKLREANRPAAVDSIACYEEFVGKVSTERRLQE